MRRLSSVLLVVSLLLVWVPVAGATESGEPAAPVSARDGDPLHLASPAVWGPTLLATGSLARAAEAAQASLRISYNLYPLGDVNDDGREDFLLVNRTTAEGEDVTQTYDVRAVSGADYSALWSLHVPDGSYWYTVGDVDGDGIKDVMVHTSTSRGQSTSQGQQGVSVSRYESTYTRNLQLVSGRTGVALFPLTCESKMTMTTVRASSPVSSANVRDFSWTECFPAAVQGAAGLDLIVQTIVDYRGPSVSAFVAGGGARIGTANIKVQRYTAAGQLGWEWKLQRDQSAADWTSSVDFTGDGIGDGIYFVYGMAPAWSHSPAGYADSPNVVPGEIGVVDGKTGRTAWTVPLDSGSYFAAVDLAGPLRAAGQQDLVVSEFHQPDPASSWQTTLRQVNGATGALLSTKVLKDRIAALRGHADVDGDGRNELAMVQSKVTSAPLEEPQIEEGVEFSIVKADYANVWGPQKFGPGDYLYEWFDEVDLDGDRVPELLVASESEQEDAMTMRFFSGATGRMLWAYEMTSAVVGFEAVGDMDGTPGDDFAITVFDLAAKAAAPATAAPSKQGGAGPGAPESEGINYADHVGRLELRRGSDRELIWQKIVHDPKDVQNVTANHVYSFARMIPDTNADATPEILFNFQTPEYHVTIADGALTIERQEQGLLFALLISGADGTTLKSYPDARASEPAVIGKAAKPFVLVPKETSDGGSAPMLAPAFVLASLSVAAWLGRRQA